MLDQGILGILETILKFLSENPVLVATVVVLEMGGLLFFLFGIFGDPEKRTSLRLLGRQLFSIPRVKEKASYILIVVGLIMAVVGLVLFFNNWPPTAEPTPSPIVPEGTPCPVVRGAFEDVWEQVQEKIGCATSLPDPRLIAEEKFEGGRMFWREGIEEDQVLALFDDGRWQIVEHSHFGGGDPAFSCPDADTPEECPPTPKRGFGKAWCEKSEIRDRLGDAIDCERGYQGETQEFQRGFMLQTDKGAIYVFYDGEEGSWERR